MLLVYKISSTTYPTAQTKLILKEHTRWHFTVAQCDCTTVSETSSMDLRQPDSEHSPVPSPSHSFNTLQSRDVSSDPHSATFTPTSTSEVSYDIFPTEAGDLETLSSLFELPADSGPLTVQSSETQADKDAAKRPDAAKEETPMGRKCGRCERPRSACLCSSLPDSPLKLSGKLVVFQHPHEQKRKLGTVQLLSKCVSPCLLFKSRKIPTTGPIRLAITSLVLEATEKGIPFFVLFPGPEAQPFSRKFLQQFDSFQNNRPPPGSEMKTENESQQPNYILLVIDGTWTQAKEMFGAIKPHIIPPGIQIVLTDSLPESNVYKLRTEPGAGLMTTMEVVAVALGILEGDQFCKSTLKPLEQLVIFQTQFNPALKERVETGNMITQRQKPLNFS